MGEDVGDAMAAQLVGQGVVGRRGLRLADPAMFEPQADGTTLLLQRQVAVVVQVRRARERTQADGDEQEREAGNPKDATHAVLQSEWCRDPVAAVVRNRGWAAARPGRYSAKRSKGSWRPFSSSEGRVPMRRQPILR